MTDAPKDAPYYTAPQLALRDLCTVDVAVLRHVAVQVEGMRNDLRCCAACRAQMDATRDALARILRGMADANEASDRIARETHPGTH